MINSLVFDQIRTRIDGSLFISFSMAFIWRYFTSLEWCWEVSEGLYTDWLSSLSSCDWDNSSKQLSSPSTKSSRNDIFWKYKLSFNLGKLYLNTTAIYKYIFNLFNFKFLLSMENRWFLFKSHIASIWISISHCPGIKWFNLVPKISYDQPDNTTRKWGPCIFLPLSFTEI